MDLIHYENTQINVLFDDLSVTMENNRKRIRENPYDEHRYHGTDIVIQVLYKNLSNVWFESKLVNEVVWAYDVTKNKTEHDLCGCTFPPRNIEEDTEFDMVFISPHFSPEGVKIVDESYVNDFCNVSKMNGLMCLEYIDRGFINLWNCISVIIIISKPY